MLRHFLHASSQGIGKFIFTSFNENCHIDNDHVSVVSINVFSDLPRYTSSSSCKFKIFLGVPANF